MEHNATAKSKETFFLLICIKGPGLVLLNMKKKDHKLNSLGLTPGESKLSPYLMTHSLTTKLPSYIQYRHLNRFHSYKYWLLRLKQKRNTLYQRKLELHNSIFITD